MNASERLRLYDRREDIGANLSTSDAEELLNKIFEKTSQFVLQDIDDNPASVVEDLAGCVESIVGEESGLRPSPRYICASYINEKITSPLLQCAADMIDRDTADAFIYWFDLADGTRHVVSRFALAQMHIQGLSDRRISEGLDGLQVWYGELAPFSPVHYADYYTTWVGQAIDARDSLDKDPTGFLLADEAVRQVEIALPDGDQALGISPFRTRELMIAGASFARDVYKKLHPLATAME